jgi:hypothetical protein
MERTEPADFTVQFTAGDVPWRDCGEAWMNEDGSIFVRIESSETMFMLVRRNP